MQARVFLEPAPRPKRELQEQLTKMLPEWFGQPVSNAKYAQQAELLDGYVAELEGERIGLLLLKQSSPTSAEIYWMGIYPAHHRSGIGRTLIDTAIRDARARGVKYLFVVTLHPNDTYEPYQRTRRFYEAMGFSYVLEEQFPADPENPSATYLRQIR
jgi:ribosomal protein S18 acetylase RimI-like enzyme